MSPKPVLTLALTDFSDMLVSPGVPASSLTLPHVRKSPRQNQVRGVRLLGSAPNARRRWLQAKRYESALAGH